MEEQNPDFLKAEKKRLEEKAEKLARYMTTTEFNKLNDTEKGKIASRKMSAEMLIINLDKLLAGATDVSITETFAMFLMEGLLDLPFGRFMFPQDVS